MHYVNQLLPPSERIGLPEDIAASQASIEQNVRALEEASQSVGSLQPHLLARALKSVNIHFKLKYELSSSIRTNLLHTLVRIYEEKVISFDQKVKLLDFARTLINKKHTPVDYVFTKWRLFWNEALAYVTRDDFSGNTCNNQMLNKLVDNLVAFMHDARKLIPAADVPFIVQEAHEKLENTMHIQSVEGLVLLMNCLPTNYSGYDDVVPVWVNIWKRISFNAGWDSCWLTLLCRARKHTRKYDWSQLTPLFHSKVKELMSLPAIRGKVPSSNAYPLAFPHFFTKLIPSTIDPKKMGLNKLAKLMYSLTLPASPSVYADPSILTPPKLYSFDDTQETPIVPGFNVGGNIHPQALELIKCIQTMRLYLYPSNAGPWTPMLAYFLTTLVSETGRHIGRNLSSTLFDSNDIAAPIGSFRVFEAPMHLETTRFLCGFLTSVMMETLYGKSQMMSQFASGCLKNLCGIDPTLGRLIIPFLLSALDPQAVNQSHQAPLAMHALTDCLHPLLYPCPIALPYLPKLLELSLPGVDPNDQQKSCTTLAMYVSLLGWVPLQKTYKAPRKESWPPSHFAMMSSQSPIDTEYTALYNSFLDEPKLQANLNQLAIAFQDWAPALLDKVFDVVEAQDEPKKGKKTAHIVGFVAECTALLFQACQDPNNDSALRTVLENKVIDFYRTRLPVNAAKLSGKIVSCVTENNPSCLGRVLTALLEPDVVNRTCSTEKLSFRMRLIAGAVRFARCENTNNLKTLQSVLTQEFLFHSDKSVRKGAWKLLKDILRGSTSCYPINNMPLPALKDGEWTAFDEKTLLFGSPNPVDRTIEYHMPSKVDLSVMANLIRATAGNALSDLHSEINKLLNLETGNGNGVVDTEKSGSTSRKIEERIQQLLKIVTKVLRGAAEVLGDDVSAIDVAAVHAMADTMDMDVTSRADDDDVEKPVALNIGRKELLKGLASEDDVQLYNQLRSQVLCVLISLGQILTTNQQGPLLQLQNNAGLVSAWLKLFSVTVKQRMASLKDTENTKKWFSVTLRVHRTMIMRTMRKGIKIRTANGTRALTVNTSNSLGAKWQAILGSAKYWLGNEYSSTSLCNRGWIQYVQRLQQFSYISVKLATQDDSPLQVSWHVAVYQLSRICQHEYDAIRQKALIAFASVHTRFGRSAINALQNMLQFIEKASASGGVEPEQLYARLSGIFLLFRQNLVSRKISRQWSLTESFIGAVNLCPKLITSVPDQDKREILSALVAEAFAKYCAEWSHVPFVAGRDSADALLKLSLAEDGFNSDGTLLTSNEKDRDSEARGLRAQAYTSFTILHLIGHNDVHTTPGMWLWAMKKLSTSHGQPVQQVALAALTRLCAISFGISAKKHAMSDTVRSAVSSHLSLGNTSNAWNNIFTGLSHARKTANDSAQWSRGVDCVLKAAATIRSSLPRKIYHVLYDRNVFSAYFSKENANLLCGLFSSGVVPFTATNVSVLIENAKNLPDESEEETRSSNATRAELFAALLRASASSTSGATSDEAAAIVDVLCKHLQEATEKISLEYCKDWAEAISMSMEQPTGQALASIVDHIVSDFSSLFSSDQDASDADDGFSFEGKKLILTQALLVADITFSVSSGCQSAIALAIAKVLNDAGASVISSYRTSRVTIACILGLLVDSVPFDQVLPIVQTILSIGKVNSEENSSKDALDMSCSFTEVLLYSCRNLSGIYTLIPKVLSVVLTGSGNANIEAAKSCHDACLLISQGVKSSLNSDDATEDVTPSVIIAALEKEAEDASWHVRETVILCLTAFMINNWTSLSVDDRKLCSKIFSGGLLDTKPEVQELSRAGFVAYLSHKTPSELQSFAEAYCRNSDKYLVLERRRKKDNTGDAANDKVDPKFANTVMMMSCLVLCFPYDMPTFMPQLVCSLVRHKRTDFLKDTISKTVLEFKRTHQDRWEEYKESFSRDQLDSLVNASHVSYCS